jgi:hypothetical protein
VGYFKQTLPWRGPIWCIGLRKAMNRQGPQVLTPEEVDAVEITFPSLRQGSISLAVAPPPHQRTPAQAAEVAAVGLSMSIQGCTRAMQSRPSRSESNRPDGRPVGDAASGTVHPCYRLHAHAEDLLMARHQGPVKKPRPKLPPEVVSFHPIPLRRPRR